MCINHMVSNHLRLKFKLICRSVNNVIILISGKTSKFTHLSSLFVKKNQIQIFENYDDFIKYKFYAQVKSKRLDSENLQYVTLLVLV